MTLALLCQFTSQHFSDVNTSIFRSLRLLGALLCRLYCAVMIEVYVLIYLSSGYLNKPLSLQHNTAYTITHQGVASS